MSTVGHATLDVIPSVRGLKKELDKQTSGELSAAGKRGGKQYGDNAGKEAASGFRSKMSAGLKGFAPLAGLVAGAGAVAFFKSAIDGASDLGESTSKVNVVFGDAAESVKQFGAQASESLGQSEAQALSAAGTFGNLLRSIGLSEAESAKFSTTMVALASDLASFNNTSVDEAITALRSGLVGETEPLKAFGVNLNDATLKAEALKQGLSDGKGTLDANAKAQAAYALILEQTTLAQGDFARTSDGLANQQKILSAQWSEMTTALGNELLPAATAFVGFMNDKGIPALSTAGGAAKDLAGAMGEVPTPIYGAAAAFVALRLASASGLSSGIAAGATSAKGAIDGLRIRTMLAADTFRAARSDATGLAKGLGAGVRPAGRLSASLKSVSTFATGAGTSLKRGLGGAVSMLGGPWGIAIGVGVAALLKFKQGQADAKAKIDEVTAALDEQTGRVTRQNEELAFKALQDKGIIDLARKYKLSLDDVRQASLGDIDASRRLNKELQRQAAAFQTAGQVASGGDSLAFADDARKIAGAVGAETTAVLKGQDALQARKDFMSGDDTTEKAATSMRDYGDDLDDARTALQKLIDKEAERALNAIQRRRDAIALRETFRAANKEAADGKKVLFDNSKAADDNMKTLLDLGDQWNGSSKKVTGAKGAYEEMREKFIRVAEKMGATREEAKLLADDVLKVPKNAKIKWQSEGYKERRKEIDDIKTRVHGLRTERRAPGSSKPVAPGLAVDLVFVSQGYKERMAEIRALRKEARRINATVQYNANGKQLPSGPGPNGYATGGYLRGPGTGTSDSFIIRASDGEFMQRKRAVDYYGADFMHRLNNLQIPKFAQGGPVTAAPAARASGAGAGVVIQNQNIYANTWEEIQRKSSRKTIRAQSDNVRMGVR